MFQPQVYKISAQYFTLFPTAPLSEPGCSTDSECSSAETCVNRQCVNPCSISNPCAKNAECQPTNHKAVCRCPAGLVGDPFTNCYRGSF